MSDAHSGVLELASKNKADLEKLNGNVFATDDPSLILILSVLHGHEIVSTGYLEEFRTTHFLFEKTDCLDTHLKHWNEVARDDYDGHLNLFLYMSALLDKSVFESFNQLFDDLHTLDNEGHN